MIGGGIKYAPAAIVVASSSRPWAMGARIVSRLLRSGRRHGALGAGDKRVLMQVVFDDGRGFICVCDQGVAGQIQADARMASAKRLRNAARLRPS